MLAYGVDLDIFIAQLKGVILSTVVKNDYEALKYETAQIRANADKYIAMLETGDNWNAFVIFDRDVLQAAGMSESLINAILANNKELIPYEFRDTVCALQREKIISEYVEENTYYRMLNGEPPIDAEEKDFVYMGPNAYGIPTDIPIHLLKDQYIQYFNSSGLREKVYAENPTKKYLLFLGTHKISYYRARKANNFEILYIEQAENKVISEDFIRLYGACRNYVMRNLYNKPDQRNYKYYDGYMGLLIIHMATQRIFSYLFKQSIRREFYDDNLIRNLFEAYNIPYIESIDLNYQKDIAKKLNVLLQKKSSNNVLFDIVSLFNYHDVNIYKYYLVKDYYKDENGDPIIIYKTIYDENNQPHTIIDAEKTFDIYFQKVDITSKDVSAELSDTSNRVEYESITGDDPYWIDDADLLNKIYDSRFNSILTKYLSIDISYELAKLMYETSHGIRMIIDDQEDYKRLYIQLPYVAEPVSLYDAVLFLCALVAKKFGLPGSVPLDAYKVAQVYGFNFKEDINILKDKIAEDIENCTGEYRSVRGELLNYLKTLNTSTLDGVRKMYEDIQTLRIWLDTAMRYSNDIEEYEAYKKIYNSILLANDTADLYTKNDGTYANTFAELLEDRRPDLYEVVKNSGNKSTTTEPGTSTGEYTASFSINNKINKVLEKLSMMSESLADIRYANDKDAMVSNIEKLINQMKSYTVDQSVSSILYLINDPHMCMLKLIDNIRGGIIDRTLIDKLEILYLDTLHQIMISRTWKTKLKLMKEEIMNEKVGYICRVIDMLDTIRDKTKINDLNMDTLIYNVFHGYMKEVGLFHVVYMNEQYTSDINADAFDVINFYLEMIKYMEKTGNTDVPVNIDEYVGKNADMYMPIYMTLLYEILCDVKVDAFERIHLKSLVNMTKESIISYALLNTDIIIAKPVTYNGDGINYGSLLLKEYWRFGYHPIKTKIGSIKNKFYSMGGNLYLHDQVGSTGHRGIFRDKFILSDTAGNFSLMKKYNSIVPDKCIISDKLIRIVNED